MSTRQARLAIHLAAILFGLTGVFGALIQANASAISLGRAGFAILTLLLVARARRSPVLRGMTPVRVLTLAGTGVLLAVHWVTFFVSVNVGGITIATLGFASFPAFIALFEVLLLRQRIQAAEWIMVTLVTLGLVLVTPSFDLHDQGLVGLLWGLLSGLSFAGLAVANRRAAAGMDSLQVATWQNLTVLLLLLPFGAVPLASAPTLDWLWLLLLGVACTGLSHYLFISSLTRLSARSAGLVIALEPVYAIAFAWWLFAQEPTARILGGATLIIAVIVWSGLRKNPE